MIHQFMFPIDKMISKDEKPSSISGMNYLSKILCKVFELFKLSENLHQSQDIDSNTRNPSEAELLGHQIETDEDIPLTHEVKSDYSSLSEKRRKSFENLKGFTPQLRSSSSSKFITVEFNTSASFLFDDEYINETVRIMVSLSGTAGYLTILASTIARKHGHDSSYNSVTHKFSVDKDGFLVIVPFATQRNPYVIRIKQPASSD